MKKQLFVLGSSLLGLAICAGVAAAGGPGEPGAEETIVAPPPAGGATTTVTEAKEEPAAKPRGFYVGGSVGGSFFEGASRNSRIWNHDETNPSDKAFNDPHDPPGNFVPVSIGHENNFMWSAFLGYRMADWLGAEVGWTDIGGFHATANNGDTMAASVDGVEARLRAWIPLGTDRVAGIFGPGIYVFQTHSPRHCIGVASCPQVGTVGDQHNAATLDPREDSGEAFTLSAGLQFKITDNILLRTEYSHFFSVLDQGVDTVTASVVFGFYDLFGQGQAGGESIGGVVVE